MGVDAACTCGTATQAAAADNTKYCQESAGGFGRVTTTKKCSNTAGTANVDAACTCGINTAVQVASGKVCAVSTAGVGVAHEPLCAGNKADGTTAAGFASATKKCSNTDGSATVDAACTCGTATQAAAADNTKYCQVSAGGFGRVTTTKKCSNTAGT